MEEDKLVSDFSQMTNGYNNTGLGNCAMEEIVFVMITFNHYNSMIMSKINLICMLKDIENFSESNLNDLSNQIELDDLIQEYKEQYPNSTIQKMVGIPYDNE